MTLQSLVRHFTLVAALVAAPACGRGDPTSPPPCASAVAVSVGRGLQPEITWQPACAVITVAVASADAVAAGLPDWQASTVAGAGFLPPVQVGASPPGTTVWGAGATLGAGAAYKVYVVRGRRGDPTGGVDSLTFTAQP